MIVTVRSCVLVSTMAVAACAAGDMRGQGPIELSPRVEASYQAYVDLTRNKFQPGYFAVSPDGRSYGAVYCPDHRCRGNSPTRAIRLCNEDRAEADCRVYARGDEVVWQME